MNREPSNQNSLQAGKTEEDRLDARVENGFMVCTAVDSHAGRSGGSVGNLKVFGP